jgi:hypothetical protein
MFWWRRRESNLLTGFQELGGNPWVPKACKETVGNGYRSLIV